MLVRAQYYVIFFTGIAEISNVPLTFYDAIKYLNLKNSYPTMYSLSGILFALTFIPIRVVWWPISNLGQYFLPSSAVHSTDRRERQVRGLLHIELGV